MKKIFFYSVIALFFQSNQSFALSSGVLQATLYHAVPWDLDLGALNHTSVSFDGVAGPLSYQPKYGGEVHYQGINLPEGAIINSETGYFEFLPKTTQLNQRVDFRLQAVETDSEQRTYVRSYPLSLMVKHVKVPESMFQECEFY